MHFSLVQIFKGFCGRLKILFDQKYPKAFLSKKKSFPSVSTCLWCKLWSVFGIDWKLSSTNITHLGYLIRKNIFPLLFIRIWCNFLRVFVIAQESWRNLKKQRSEKESKSLHKSRPILNNLVNYWSELEIRFPWKKRKVFKI